MGYIISNKNDKNSKSYFNNNNKNSHYDYNKSSIVYNHTLINPIKATKFPNRSLFHKLQISNESKFDTFKLLSKWFEMPPLNQYINTPSPPTPPPNRLTKCTNNPENLLVCQDCINLMISKFLFLKLEIDIQDLFNNSNSNSNKSNNKSLLIYPDLIYKHRRRFRDYANKLMSKPNTNFRSHIERQFRENSNSSIPINNILISNRDNIDSDSDDDNNNDNDNDNNNNNNLGSNINPFEVNPIAFEEFEPIENEEEFFNWQDNIDFNGMIFNDDNIDILNNINNNEEEYLDVEEEEEEEEEETDENLNDLNSDDEDEERNSYSRNSNLLDRWPLSAERFNESHPILEPGITSNDEGDNTDNDNDDDDDDDDEDDDFDNPYNIIFTNDRSRRVSRLLFNINMAREQHRHKRVPVSSLKLYKNGSSRLKMTMLVCINRTTGELHMVPGNMDINMWSNEQNNGELFEDIETFNKVFKLFMEVDKEDNKESSYTKKIKKWMKTKRKEEVEEIKKLMVLQLLTNPSIINGYNKRKESYKENHKEEQEQKVKFQQSKYNKMEKKGKQSILKKKKSKFDNNENNGLLNCGNFKEHGSELNNVLGMDQYNDNIKEHLLSLMGDNFNFDIDNDKVLTFQYGTNENGVTNNNKQGLGSSLSFEFA
ncbi:hypothetical protein C6P40_003552 [Pichia californica]|uniref:Uncharacterized protein n=1 Tax=Pichia californica TaxID=460514 RepID=A0A9P7BDB3_9ASCO|nr:hypothetical protein C6P40_003552 [[Candida] californica]